MASCKSPVQAGRGAQPHPKPGGNLKQLQSENFALRSEIRKLRQETTTVRRLFSQQQQQCQSLKKEKLRWETLETQVAENEKLIEKQKEEILEVRGNLIEICEKNNSVHEELNKERHKTSKLEEDIRRTSGKLRNELEEIKQLEEKLKYERSRCRDKIGELMKVRKEAHEMACELEKAVETIARKEHEIRNCNQIIARQREREDTKEEKSKKEMELQLKNDADIINGLNNFIQELELRLGSLQMQLENYENFINGPFTMESVPEALLKKHDRIKEIVNWKMQTEMAITEKQEKIVSLEEQLKKSSSDKDEKMLSLENQMKRSVSEKQEKIESLENQLKVSSSTKQETITSLENQLKSSASDKQEKIAYLENQLQKVVAEKQEKIFSLEIQLRRATDQLKRFASEKQETIKTLENQLRRSAADKHERITALENQLKRLASDKQEKITSLENQLKRQASEKQEKITSLETELRKSASGNHDKLASLESQIKKLTSDKQDRINSLESQLKRLTSDKQEKMVSLQNELKKLASDKQEKLESLEAKVKSMEDNESFQNNLIKKQCKYIAELEEQTELLDPALEENRNMMRKCEEWAAVGKKQEEQLKEAEEILREQQRIISDHQRVLASMDEMHKNEKDLLEAIIKQKQEEVAFLVRERHRILGFLEGIKACSEFTGRVGEPTVTQLVALEAHVRKRLAIVHKFCELISKSAEVRKPVPEQEPEFVLPTNSDGRSPPSDVDTPPATPQELPSQDSAIFPVAESQPKSNNMKNDDGLHKVKASIVKKKPVNLLNGRRKTPIANFQGIQAMEALKEAAQQSNADSSNISHLSPQSSEKMREDEMRVEIIDLTD